MNKKFNFFTRIIFIILFFTVINVQARSIEDRVDRLERKVNNPVLMQLSRKIGEQQREIQNLYDKIDRLQYKLDLIQTKQSDRYKETDDRLSSLENGGNDSTSKNNKQSFKYNALKTTPSREVLDIGYGNKTIKTRQSNKLEKQKYNAAFALMKSRKYEKSRKAFVNFKDTHPNSILASNALYWAGEASSVLNKNELALKYFLEVISAYPNSFKAPDSLLRAGDSYRKLGEQAKAKEAYQLLLKKYPKSKAVKSANKRLNN
jgi:tol-pal system protein YbgF